MIFLESNSNGFIAKYKIFQRNIYDTITPKNKKGIKAGISKAIELFILAVIIGSTLLIILETIQSVYNRIGFILPIIDRYIITIFSIEYIIRVWACTAEEEYSKPILGRLRYMFSFLALIDLLAILPFFLPTISINLSFLRILRSLRIIRLFKVSRFLKSSISLFDVIKSKKIELLTTLFVILLLIIIASTVMFYVENPYQPLKFSSIPATFWWAVVTLTTIGYGDAVPISLVGRILAGVIALLGVGIVSIPSGIIASGFSEAFMKRKEGIVSKFDYEDHIVICGWNSSCIDIVRFLIHKRSNIDSIVVIANINETPQELEILIESTNKDIEFISGNPSTKEVIEKANIKHSRSAIIVTEEGMSSSDTILVAAAIESVDPTIYATVVINNSDTKRTVESMADKFNIDEIICIDELASSIAVNSSVHRGLSHIINELCDFGKGSNFYKIGYKKLPKEIKSLTYQELGRYMLEKSFTLLALERKMDGITMRPKQDYVLQVGDSLFVIADREPF